MTNLRSLSRRERQILDVLFASGGATVNEVRDQLPHPPTDKAVRRMLEILEEKRLVTRRKVGRGFVYKAKQSRRKAGASALRHVLNTFFDGSLDQAVAVHLGSNENEITEEELKKLSELIKQVRKQGK